MSETVTASAQSTAPKKRQRRPAKKRRKQRRSHSARTGTPPPLMFDLLRVPASSKLTIVEIAAAVRRSAQTVRLWATQPNHPIRFHRIDGRTMATVGDVLTYLNTPTQVTTSKRSR